MRLNSSTLHDASIEFSHNGAYGFTMGSDETDRSFKISSGNALGTNDRFVIDSSGNVGMGTSNPSAFHSYARNLVIGEGGSDYEGITIYTDSSRQGSIHFADGTAGNQAYAGYVSYRHSNRTD